MRLLYSLDMIAIFFRSIYWFSLLFLAQGALIHSYEYTADMLVEKNHHKKQNEVEIKNKIKEYSCIRIFIV